MPKPVKGTNGADTLFGTAIADKVKALGGNDKVFGLNGGDSVDGGGGLEWATFSGSIGDYLIDAKGTGNNKVTVTSDTGEVIDLKKVEYLVFDNGTPDFADDELYNTELGTILRPDATLSAEAQESPGEVFNGSGNSAHDYVVVQNPDIGLELGLQIKYRQGPTIDPVSIEDDGTVHFDVAAGPQDTANGSFQNAANRAAWSFDYSIGTGLDGATTDLSDFEFKLLLDFDITDGTEFLELTSAPGGSQSGVVWVDGDGNVVIGDDQGVLDFITQNSQNVAFYPIDGDPDADGFQPYNFGPASFDIQLQAYQDGDLVAANSVVVDVGGGWDPFV